jgi:hypothetical protein
METMTEWVRLCVKSAWKKETKSETLVLSPLILLNYGNWSANIPTISYRDQIQGASRYLGARRHDVRNILVPVKWRFGRLEYWGLAWIPTTGAVFIKIMCPIGRLGETRMQELRRYLPTLLEIVKVWRELTFNCCPPENMKMAVI